MSFLLRRFRLQRGSERADQLLYLRVGSQHAASVELLFGARGVRDQLPRVLTSADFRQQLAQRGKLALYASLDRFKHLMNGDLGGGKIARA